MMEERRAALTAIVARLARSGRSALHVLEVGSYEGMSALVWSAAIARYCADGGGVHCVDPWLPYLARPGRVLHAGQERMEAELASGEAFARFRRNAALADPCAPISYFRGTLAEACVFEGAFGNNEDGRQFDIVYIDGAHDYASVRADIVLVQPLVAPGGVLCGDDLEEVIKTEDQAAALRPYACEEWWRGCHPGVSLAVWDAFGTEVAVSSGVWAVQQRVDHDLGGSVVRWMIDGLL